MPSDAQPTPSASEQSSGPESPGLRRSRPAVPATRRAVRERDRRRARSRRTSPQERRLVYLVAGVAAVAAVVAADTAPAEAAVANALLRAGFTLAVVLAGSRSRRWTWLVLCGIAALIVESGPWLAVTGLGLVAGFASVLMKRHRAMGALTCALGVLPLFHTGSGLGKATGLVCLASVAPVIVSGYHVSPRRIQRRIRIAGYAVAGLTAAAALLWGAAAAFAYPSVNRGSSLATEGLEKVRDGDSEGAAPLLAESASAMRSANDLLSGPWAKPALAVPGLAQHARALDVATEEGEQLAAVGANTAAKVDYSSLGYVKGRADLARVRDAQVPLRQAAVALSEADDHLVGVRSDVLVGPIRARLDDLIEQVARARVDAVTASMAADAAPGLLGGDGTRRYFVLFTTPAELRGLGGFMGNWGVLEADNGKLRLAESGRAKELNDRVHAAGATLEGPEDFLLRYQRWHIEDHVQDITMPPDLPTVAEVMGGLYTRTTGQQIDGALVIDPYGLAALLELTGPVEVPGAKDPLRADNAVDILLTKQYADFPDTEAREQFLEDALRASLEKLTSASLPEPNRLVSVLGPPVKGRRIMFWTTRPDEQALLDRIGLSGRFGGTEGADFLAITTQNNASNKIDVYFEREIAYRVTIDPATGDLKATAEVKLTNTAPSAGLPDAVLASNDKGYAPGTNAVYFSLYTPHGLRSATVDGEDRSVEFQRELGQNVYSTRVAIPAGATVTIAVELSGELPPGRAYRLDYLPQPTVRPDALNVTLTPSPLWLVKSATATEEQPFAAELDGTKAIMAAAPESKVALSATFQRR